MIVDNFDIIRGLLKFDDKDDFYFLQIIQRKKDGEQTLEDNPVDACYEMIIKLHESKML